MIFFFPALFTGLLLLTGCASTPEPPPKKAPVVSFQERASGTMTTGKYRGLAVADIDNDGQPDIAGGSSWPGTVAVWYGDGKGTLSKPQFLPFKGDVRAVAIEDLDGDGRKDIICSVQREAAGVMVWRNRPDFKWEKGISPIESGTYEGLAVADINQDGRSDIAAAGTTSDERGGIKVWLNDGRGEWLAEAGPTIQGRYMDVALADFNRDGALDLAGAGWGTYGALRVWFGNGQGSWSAEATIHPGSYYGLTVTDVDGDGKQDILAATYRNGVQIFLGDDEGHFSKIAGPADSGSFWKALAIDLDGDGRNEILATSLDAAGVAAWKQQPDDTWLPLAGRFPTRGIYYTIAAADLNKDGRRDLCVASFEDGVKIWLNQGEANIPKRSVKKEISTPQLSSDLADIRENDVFTSRSGRPEYKIGPGDLLEITFWRGTEGKKEEILVRANGHISFGFVEDLKVTGMTAGQLDQILTDRLNEFIKNPRIDVVVKKYESKYVSLVGAINTNPNFRSGPGDYNLTGKTSLLEMVTRAGGPTNDANLNRVNIRRKDGRAFTVDLYKVFTEGDQSQNVILDDGDLVVIPKISKEANRVYIFGEVNKPGVYTFTGSGMRLSDVVAEAGGVTVFAKEKYTKIVRGDIARPEVISADMKLLIEKGDISQNVTLANGDLVYVPRSFIGDINRFVQQVTPLMRLVIYPAQVVNEYGTAGDWLSLP